MVKKIIRTAIGLFRRYGPAFRSPGGLALVLGVGVFLGTWAFSEKGRIWFGGLPSGGVRYDLVEASEIAELKSHYEKRGKDFDTVISGEVPAPRLVVVGLPGDLVGEVPIEERKSAFLATVLPAVLIANREIMVERLRLLRLIGAERQGRDIPAEDRDWLAEMAERYGTAPAAPGKLRHRIDVIPVSLAVAQAAVESGWGAARFAQEGTALYGIHGHNGEDAVAAQEKDGLYLRGYDSVLASVRDYARLLNSHQAYAAFRETRARRQAAGHAMSGTVLAGTLTRYSELNETYVKILRRVIRDNGLERLDAARLEEDPSGEG